VHRAEDPVGEPGVERLLVPLEQRPLLRRAVAHLRERDLLHGDSFRSNLAAPPLTREGERSCNRRTTTTFAMTDARVVAR
jgi:hypothetical protein